MGNGQLTPEQAVLARYVEPSESATTGVETSLVRDNSGEIVRVTIRSDKQYEAAREALTLGRSNRTAFEHYWKDDPKKPAKECSPGEGMGFFTRQAWESANSIFNLYHKRLTRLFGTVREGGLIDQAMTDYRAEVERKAREEAERKAAEERARLEAIAAEERRKAEEERRRQEAELRAQREKAEREAREAREREEAERQKRLAAELESAKSKKAKEEAERRAREEKERADREAEEKRQLAEIAEQEEAERIEREAAEREAEALRIQQEADSVVAIPTKEAPKGGRRKWKARVTDLQKLVNAVAEGKAPLACLKADESQCNKLAMAFGGVNPPPGLQFYPDETTVTRSR